MRPGVPSPLRVSRVKASDTAFSDLPIPHSSWIRVTAGQGPARRHLASRMRQTRGPSQYGAQEGTPRIENS